MKAKLLKRLRTEAYRRYGIKGYFHTSDGGGVYIVGMRGLPSQQDEAQFSVEDAKKVLATMRNEYCAGRVSEMRVAKYYRL